MKKLATILLLFFVCPWVKAAAPPLHTVEAGGVGPTGSFSCDFSALTTAGNFYASGIYIQSTTSTITSCHDSQSNTYNLIGPYRSSSGTTYMAWMIPASGGIEFLFNCDIDGHAGSIGLSGDQECAEYTGMAGAATVQDCFSGNNGNSGALDSGTCTPTAGNDLIIGFGAVQQNLSNATAGTGFTLRMSQPHSSLGDSCGYEDKNNTTCVALSAPMTMSVAGQWAMAMAAFKTSSPTGCGNSITIAPGSGSIMLSPGAGTIKLQ